MSTQEEAKKTQFDAAQRFQQANDPANAEILYLKILQENSEDLDAQHFLGLCHFQQGLLQQGLKEMEDSLLKAPDRITFRLNLAEAYLSQNLIIQSLEQLRLILNSEPDNLEAKRKYARIMDGLNINFEYENTLGTIEAEFKHYDEALTHFKKAEKALKNSFLPIQINLVQAYTYTKDFQNAMKICEDILKDNPKNLMALEQLINTLIRAGEYDKAQEKCGYAFSLSPDKPSIQLLQARIYRFIGRIDDALVLLEKIISVEPKNLGALHVRSELLLMTGQFDKAWSEFEIRFHPKLDTALFRQFKEPRWDGSPLNGRTLLLHWEQGRGDMIQFIRYVKLIKKNKGRIIFETTPETASLFKCVPEIDELFELDKSFPPHDVQLSLMSLPLVFNTRLENIPTEIPYFSIPKDSSKKLPEFSSKKLKVGVAWRGSKKHKYDKFRSIPFDQFSSLFPAKNKKHPIQFYSLQFDEDDAVCERLKKEFNVINLAPLCKNFLDSAQYIQQLDLVISVDTALIHLAGALDIPTWNLITYLADWRWLLNRDDSPWYPKMKLFRQAQRNEWEPVLKTVRKKLEAIDKIPV